MVSQLRLEFAGNQARNLGGQYLGLPVISLAGAKARSMPNLLPQEKLLPKQPGFTQKRATPQQTQDSQHNFRGGIFQNQARVDNTVGTQVYIQDFQNSKVIHEEYTQDEEEYGSEDQKKSSVHTEIMNATQTLTRHNSKVIMQKSVGLNRHAFDSIRESASLQPEPDERMLLLDDSEFTNRSPPAIYRRNELRDNHISETSARLAQTTLKKSSTTPQEMIGLRLDQRNRDSTLGLDSTVKDQQEPMTPVTQPGTLEKSKLPQPPINFIVKQAKNFNFKPPQQLNRSTKPPPIANKRPTVQIQTFSSIKMQARSQTPQAVSLQSQKSQKIDMLERKELLLHKKQAAMQTIFVAPSYLEQTDFKYKIYTNDQFTLKFIKQGQFQKVQSRDRQIRGVVLAKLGQFQKARQLLEGENLVVCLLEMRELQEAYLVASEVAYVAAIDYITNEQNEKSQYENSPEFRTLEVTIKHSEIECESKQEQQSQQTMTIDLNNDDKDKLYFYEKQPIKKVSSTIQMQKIDTNSNGQITNMTCPPIPMGRESKSVIIATEMIDGKKSDDGFSMKPTSVIQKSVPHLEDLKLIGSKDSIQGRPPRPVASMNISPERKPQMTQSKSSFLSINKSIAKQVQDIKTEDLLQSLVQQQLADINRFKFYIGGKEKMDEFIAKYAQEWRSGQIQKTMTKGPQTSYSFVKQEESAYDQSQSKYSQFKGTINLLVENYLKGGTQKSVSNFSQNSKVKHSEKSKFGIELTNSVEQQQEDDKVNTSSPVKKPHHRIVISHDSSDLQSSVLKPYLRTPMRSVSAHYLDSDSSLDRKIKAVGQNPKMIFMRDDPKTLEDHVIEKTQESQSFISHHISKMAKTNFSYKKTFNPIIESAEMAKVVECYDIPENLQSRFATLEAKCDESTVQTPRIEEVMKDEIIKQRVLNRNKTSQNNFDDSYLNDSSAETKDGKQFDDKFWSSVDVAYKDPFNKTDIFMMDEEKQKEIYSGLTNIIEKMDAKIKKPSYQESESVQASIPSLQQQQNSNEKPAQNRVNLICNFMKQIQQQMDEPGISSNLFKWLRHQFEEFSVSETLQGLLQNRLGELEQEEGPIECLEKYVKQPLGSILLLIREEFAKLKKSKEAEACLNVEQLESGIKKQQSKIEPDSSLNVSRQNKNSGQRRRSTLRVNPSKVEEDEAEKSDSLLSKMLSRINYFSHFQPDTRRRLVMISNHSIFRAGETVIHSDVLHDKILVVISGAVSVFMKDKEKPDDFEQVRHTLYPGDSIGDAPLRLILTSDKMYFNLRAAVESDVLVIDKDEIPRILFKNEEKFKVLLQNKIMPLQSCSLFAGEDHQSPYTIFVLANLVDIVHYHYGDVIQKQGSQADDVMYLVVEGYARAIYESTLTKQESQAPLKFFSNSKQVYGEVGVITNHLQSVDPDRLVRNVKLELRPVLDRMKPGYLAPVSKKRLKISYKSNKHLQAASTISDYKRHTEEQLETVSNDDDHQKHLVDHQYGMFGQEMDDMECEEETHLQYQGREDATKAFQKEEQLDSQYKGLETNIFSKVDPPLNTDTSKSTEMTNRTQLADDKEALVGHRGAACMENKFPHKQKKDRIIENILNPLTEPEVTDVQTLQQHADKINLTEDVDKFKSMKQETKLTAHIDVVQYQQSIGVGQMFCTRALLEQERSKQNLKLCLNDFCQNTVVAAGTQPEKEKKDKPIDTKEKPNIFNQKSVKDKIKRNDEKLTADVKESKQNKSPKQDQQEDAQTGEQTNSVEPKDPVWRDIFNNLRNLLGDAEVKRPSTKKVELVLEDVVDGRVKKLTDEEIESRIADQRLNHKVEELFAELNKSQLTIVADSSDLVLLKIKQHDLTQLSEPVRRRIEREIKDKLFVDYDRPFTTKEQIDSFVNQYKSWHKTRQQVSEQVQRDKRNRK